MKDVIYQLQGYIDWESRPNIEVLIEDDDKELVFKIKETYEKYMSIRDDAEINTEEVDACRKFLEENGFYFSDDEEYENLLVCEITSKKRSKNE